MSNIRLSEKYGVNPALPKCYYCLENKNEILLLGHLPGDAEAPQGVVWDDQPCDKCAEFMKQGIILISVRDGEEDKIDKDSKLPNPHRTGCFAVVAEVYIRRVIQPEETAERIIKQRVAFVPDAAWDLLGLPRTDTTGDNSWA